MPGPIIEIHDLTFQYHSQAEPTLKNVSLRIEPGQKVAIVGRSGCGKSTLINVLNSLGFSHFGGRLTSGHVNVAGLDPASASLVDVSRHVGTVLQNSADQFVGLTVSEDIAFSLENQGVPQADMRDAVRAAATRVGIADHLDSAPQDLSGGQKQRVAMAGVLVDDVDILLFDEPLAMLDPASGRQTIELIDRLNRELGKTVIIVEHRLEDVLHCGLDRVVLMNDGVVVADLAPDEMVASGLLEAHGIRPPLHSTALRYAGVDITAQMRPSNAAFTVLDEGAAIKLRAWVADAPTPDAHTSGERPAAIRVENLSVSYEQNGDLPPVRVLEELSTSITQGSLVGIVGSNGAGKSTLARAIAGFAKPNAGAIIIDGQDASAWSLAEHGQRVGFVLQEPGQMLSSPYVREEVELALRAHNLPPEEIAKRSEEALQVCGLWRMRSWPISALSHGQKKRLTIAIMLALGPKILILDEPTAGQDFGHYTEFMDFLRSLNRLGTTVILITHDMHLALDYTERTLVISDGHIIADAHPSAVLTNPDVTERADLVTTGLYTLAERYKLDAEALVRRFLSVDRAARSHATGPGGVVNGGARG
ncbi:ABC transporter ATP-binding protein [Trueperella pecoris]|uniref:ABC transporter ATP-binding protein n=1 Tax=Trueperella pecoris TaxID=2733571 RepID=A0A7M1QZ34_9ACTO|nr:ABC transporter ATP-binding protein [Trueperella pecoris]QOR47153.1 ABC transporter ATP-binding protein [Trueperella pecoris]